MEGTVHILKLRERGIKTCKENIPFAKEKYFDLWVIVNNKKEEDAVVMAHREGWCLIL